MNETDFGVAAKSVPEWRKHREEKKAKKRKWNEEKTIKKLKKEKLQADFDSKSKAPSTNGREYTVSIALPGSILRNAQTPELGTYLIGQIARAATVFNVDEIIVFDESGTMSRVDGVVDQKDQRTLCCIKMARVLQYLECPQYLRKSLFPMHDDLKFVSVANPLDSPHHMRTAEDAEFREGVVVDKPVREGRGSFVNVGLGNGGEVQIDVHLMPRSRVTVQLDKDSAGKRVKGRAVAPSYPRLQRGLYWGYEVRVATSLHQVERGCPYAGGYDAIIGTSERGNDIDAFTLPPFAHLLVVFGGLKGLELSIDSDPDLETKDPREVFQYYLNTCPTQGSRTIRTEEAILITMAALRPKILSASTSG